MQSFDGAYVAGTPPWDIGHAQPAFQRLADASTFTGHVLDVGCGTGEHALMAAQVGLDATGIDSAPTAIERAQAKAAERGLVACFVVGDALDLEQLDAQFNTVLDCGFFHVLDAEARVQFLPSLAAVMSPGARYYMLAFSDRMPGDFGPRRLTEAEIRATFVDGWRVVSIDPAPLETTMEIPGNFAWLSVIERV